MAPNSPSPAGESPAIDAGVNGAIPPGVTTDQRGGNFVRVFNGIVDIGAVEVQPPPKFEAGQILNVSGVPNGTAVLLNPGPVSTSGASAASTLSPFGALATDLRVATGDINGDRTPDTILVTGPGTPIRVAVISGANNSTVLVAPFDPFGGDFTGGGFVAGADIDRDGRAEFVVTPDRGGGPRVSIFSLNVSGSIATRANFFGIDDPNFRGGCRAALGDINNDGTPDLACAAGFLGGPRTAIFNGTTLLSNNLIRIVNDFFAFPGTDAVTLRNGVFVAVGDVNGDSFADLIFGGGPGGAPRVFILSGVTVSSGDVAGAQANPIGNFFVAGNGCRRRCQGRRGRRQRRGLTGKRPRLPRQELHFRVRSGGLQSSRADHVPGPLCLRQHPPRRRRLRGVNGVDPSYCHCSSLAESERE